MNQNVPFTSSLSFIFLVHSREGALLQSKSTRAGGKLFQCLWKEFHRLGEGEEDRFKSQLKEKVQKGFVMFSLEVGEGGGGFPPLKEDIIYRCEF